jgi:PAS domain S-box-containing protein
MHFVRFYQDDASLSEAIACFLGKGLDSGGAAFLVATARHRSVVVDRLGSAHLARAEREGRFSSLDAEETAASLLVDGAPDPRRFEERVGREIQRLSADGERLVWAFGEMVGVLSSRGMHDAAAGLEGLWNRLGERLPFSLFCAYPGDCFEAAGDGKRLLSVCGQHDHVIPSERYVGAAATDEHLRLLVENQERSFALEREVARRRELEEVLRRREKEFHAVLDDMQQAVVDLDPDGKVRWANRSCLDRLGYAREEYVGRSVTEFLVSRDVFDLLWSGLARGQPLRGSLAGFRRKDGSVLSMRIHSSALRMEGEAIHMRVFLRD